MSPHDSRSRILGLGVFLLPLLLVKGTALMMDQPPQSARAGVAMLPPPDAIMEAYQPEWTLGQVAAAHRVAELRTLPFGESPLLHAKKPDEDPVEVIDTRPKEIKPPNVAVQVILRSRRGNVALIDRKHYRAGDAIGDKGWVVKEIDADTRSVVLIHPESGTEATLVVPMPR